MSELGFALKSVDSNPGAPDTQICPREDCHLVGEAGLTHRNPLEKNASSTKSMLIIHVIRTPDSNSINEYESDVKVLVA